ncbi:hypothetical protein [Primorskyibacter sedentarius]|uniref:hypothetical protein n=1 Tax=Primorskyibacter sedentarius TaxID=745311 RepID=UPI003EBE29A8
MTKAAALLCCLAYAGPPALAEWRPFETQEEAATRHQAERYDRYRLQGAEPLGGYSDSLGDPGGHRDRYPRDRYNPPSITFPETAPPRSIYQPGRAYE